MYAFGAEQRPVDLRVIIIIFICLNATQSATLRSTGCKTYP